MFHHGNSLSQHAFMCIVTTITMLLAPCCFETYLETKHIASIITCIFIFSSPSLLSFIIILQHSIITHITTSSMCVCACMQIKVMDPITLKVHSVVGSGSGGFRDGEGEGAQVRTSSSLSFLTPPLLPTTLEDTHVCGGCCGLVGWLTAIRTCWACARTGR